MRGACGGAGKYSGACHAWVEVCGCPEHACSGCGRISLRTIVAAAAAAAAAGSDIIRGSCMMRLRLDGWLIAATAGVVNGSGRGRADLDAAAAGCVDVRNWQRLRPEILADVLGRMRSIEPFEKGPNSLLKRLDRTKAGKGNQIADARGPNSAAHGDHVCVIPLGASGDPAWTSQLPCANIGPAWTSKSIRCQKMIPPTFSYYSGRLGRPSPTGKQ